jgi:hypothetical protein
MRLKKKQKEAVLEWIAEGLQTDEINQRAADFNPPFSVTRSNVSKYRSTRKTDLDTIKKVSEKNALSAGFALKEYRVLRLSQLAEMMAKDIFGGFLWTEEVKGVGAGAAAEIVDYDEFNRAEVEAFRGVLDDIAAEMGARTKKIEGSGEDGAILVKMIEVVKHYEKDDE